MANLAFGAYDRLVTESLRAELSRLPDSVRAELERLSKADAVEYLAREIGSRLRARLRELVESEDEEFLGDVNQRISAAGFPDAVELERLIRVGPQVEKSGHAPLIPLSQSALVTNEQGLNYHAILRSELLSSDRVDFICPFIGNQGINLIFDLLAGFGNRLRVITTTYLGGTNQRALERLVETGAQVKIVYERPEQKTSLHAKAWVFHRETGFTTATIGSSNLSPRALVDGLEWNVRLGRADAGQVLDELIVTFDRLWADTNFETFDRERDGERLSRALRAQSASDEGPSFFADLRPLPHQQEALDEIAYARLDGKNENLIVAATGTGKTLLAAFDYQRLAKAWGGRPSLLFVAHREDILRQSRGAFRAVMRDSDFGELNVGQERARAWKHVFASVASLRAMNLALLDPARFDLVVIDEFHHAEAPSYLRLLDHFRPRQLLGLTATPERGDGKNVIDRFGAPTYELRLWHALERQLLCPFHYFGLDDGTDLRGLVWQGGRYADGDLEELFISKGQERANLIVRELLEKVDDPERMHAVAFCATVAHAEYMAERFRNAGLRAEALHSRMTHEARSHTVSRFRKGELPILCTVDLFNEGVDIPEIDTVLFLRPTESATVFIQQLGRGLRNHPDKGALTALDFVGLQNQKFRMDLRFRAMTGLSRTDLDRAVRSDFPTLPPGCSIRLDRTTQERVLRNLKEAIPSNTASLVAELRRLASTGADVTLRSLLIETGLEPLDFYRSKRSFAKLMHEASLSHEPTQDTDRAGSFWYVDDRRRLQSYRRCLETQASYDAPFDRMLSFPLTGAVEWNGGSEPVRSEMVQLLDALEMTAASKPGVANDLPFCLHAHYSRDEIVAPFRTSPKSMMAGIFYDSATNVDFHLVTLRKSDQDFSPTTRYADYFIGPDLLHWESQSTTSLGSPTGQRLIQSGSRVLFFVRESKTDRGETMPFLCLGFATLVSYESEKPIRIMWKLDHPVPDHIYVKFRNAAG